MNHKHDWLRRRIQQLRSDAEQLEAILTAATDSQSDDLLAACYERGIYSRGDLEDRWPKVESLSTNDQACDCPDPDFCLNPCHGWPDA